MSGICSRHQENEPTCSACQAHPSDLLPDYDRKVAEAEAVGLVTCHHCEFRYYLTTWHCPKCSTMWKDAPIHFGAVMLKLQRICSAAVSVRDAFAALSEDTKKELPLVLAEQLQYLYSVVYGLHD